MANFFDEAVAVVFEHEGGYSNNPNDKGGETNFGISHAFIQSFDLAIDIKSLTQADAKALYYKYVWLPNNFEALSNEKIAIKLFDTAVNIGPQTAIKMAQEIVEIVFPHLTLDGILGKNTATALNLIDTDYFLQVFKAHLIAHYESLVKTDSKLAPFLEGWLIRANS